MLSAVHEVREQLGTVVPSLVKMGMSTLCLLYKNSFADADVR
jgi:hypothetical protein